MSGASRTAWPTRRWHSARPSDRVIFRPLATRTVRWRPVDGDGLEHLSLSRTDGAIIAESVVIGERGGGPYGVHYRIVCDHLWRVRTFSVHTTSGKRLSLVSDGLGKWADAEGKPLPDFDGCIDIDLAGSPFTNTLPIRRRNPQKAEGAIGFRMLYVPFDNFEPTVDAQIYTCLEEGRLFRYEAGDRSFSADLPVDEDGLVLDYPTLFERA